MEYKFKTSPKRSSLMKKIKSEKTAPEILLQKALRKEKIKFRKNYRILSGIPDIALLDKKVVVFIDGEFWHGYRWRIKKKKIRANRSYWIPKIERNIIRDKKNTSELKRNGWIVLRFWQHQINKDLSKCIQEIRSKIKKRLR